MDPNYSFYTSTTSLPNCDLSSDVRMYADDTNLSYASKDPDELFSFPTRDLGKVNLGK